MPLPAKNWFPFTEDSIPPKDRMSLTVQWLTNYFDNGDIRERDESKISFIVPSTTIVPSIYSMHPYLSEIVFPDALAGSDGLLMKFLGAQLSTNYHKACYSKEVKELFPHLKVWEITGDMTGSFGVLCYWQIQDDDRANGGEIGRAHV